MIMRAVHRVRITGLMLSSAILSSAVLLNAGGAIAAEPASLAGAESPSSESFSTDSSLDAASEMAPASLDQVTSVSQLSDVKPTDWAFQALQSLVERYGCIAGYPDKTYRGNRSLTRYEFAAGLNACMDRVNELISASTADMAKREDLEALRKLQEEFAAELATLRGRVDTLEARTSTLEKQQFSTTTKLKGEVIFSVAGGYGGAPGSSDANTAFNDRVRLNLNTSFSGKDLLITGLQAYNFSSAGSFASTLGLADPVLGSSSNARLSYEPQFPDIDPTTLTPRGGNNQVELYKLLYIFPVAKKLTAFAGTSAEVSDAFPAILPFAGEGNGGISRFSTLPAAQRISGGTSQFGLASAAGFIFNASDTIDFRALYGTLPENLTSNQGFPGTPLGAGIFNGSYVAAAQLTVKPSKAFDIGLNYAHSYHQINILGAGLGSSDIGAVRFLPGANVSLAEVGEPIKMDTLGISAAYKLSPQITLAGSYTHVFSNLVNVNASTDFNSWLAGVHVKDVLKKGNSAGLVIGQPLSRTAVGGLAFKPENRKPFQIEGYLNYQVNDNISITPGLFVLFNPEGLSANDTTFMPVVRTTFSF
jgi:Carbohydrate-selective porin, OprB family/S-layer homology domain